MKKIVCIKKMGESTLKREKRACRMNDRFSGLRDSINRDKKNREKQIKNEKRKNKNNNNQFRKQNQNKVKEVKIDHSEVSFPCLTENTNSKVREVTENYLEKTKKIKEEKEKKNSQKVPEGWIILHKGMNTKNLICSEKPEINEYYNPTLARKIMEDREIFREELNELLGDISPYWDMSWLDNDDDYDYDENLSDEDTEEEEYVEDW